MIRLLVVLLAVACAAIPHRAADDRPAEPRSMFEIKTMEILAFEFHSHPPRPRMEGRMTLHMDGSWTVSSWRDVEIMAAMDAQWGNIPCLAQWLIDHRAALRFVDGPPPLRAEDFETPMTVRVWTSPAVRECPPIVSCARRDNDCA